MKSGTCIVTILLLFTDIELLHFVQTLAKIQNCQIDELKILLAAQKFAKIKEKPFAAFEEQFFIMFDPTQF